MLKYDLLANLLYIVLFILDIVIVMSVLRTVTDPDYQAAAEIKAKELGYGGATSTGEIIGWIIFAILIYFALVYIIGRIIKHQQDLLLR